MLATKCELTSNVLAPEQKPHTERTESEQALRLAPGYTNRGRPCQMFSMHHRAGSRTSFSIRTCCVYRGCAVDSAQAALTG